MHRVVMWHLDAIKGAFYLLVVRIGGGVVEGNEELNIQGFSSFTVDLKTQRSNYFILFVICSIV